MKSREEIERKYLISWIDEQGFYQTITCDSTLGEFDFIRKFYTEDGTRTVLFFKVLSD